MEEKLVKEYQDSFLMGNKISSSTVVKNTNSRELDIIKSSFSSFFMQYINLRVDSITVDMLIRNKPLACAPHMNNEFYGLNKRDNSMGWDYSVKWSLSQKLYANLSETIVYICQRCFISGKFKFAVLPLSVSSERNANADHKNMLVLHYKDDIVEVMLFEPNGETYGREKTDYISFLDEAVEYSNEILSDLRMSFKIMKPVLVGGEGIQNFLGFQEVTETTTRFLGLPICSLVTYWTITKWISSEMESVSFKDFTETLVEEIKANREEKKKEVYDFIIKTNKDIHDVFEEKIKEYIEKDKPLITEKYNRYLSKSTVTFDVSVSVTSQRYFYYLHVEFKFK